MRDSDTEGSNDCEFWIYVLMHILGSPKCFCYLITSFFPAINFLPLSRQMVGKALVYIVEIINKVQALDLNYGIITRDSPVRSEVTVGVKPTSTNYVTKLGKC